MRERLHRALPATAFVHACLALCALSAALPLAHSVAEPVEAEPQNVQLLLVIVRLWNSAARAPAQFAALPLLFAFFGGPWLRVFWLSALRQPGVLHEHARAANSCYRPALALGASAAGAGVALLTAGLGLWLFAGVLHELHWQSALGLMVFVPVLLAGGAYLALIYDTAQLQLVLPDGPRGFRSALRAGARCIDRKLLAARAGYALALALLSLGALTPRAWFDAFGSALLGQLLLLAQTGLRAVWFCQLIKTFESGSPAPRAAGSTTPTR
jgi:hypothetical protein